MDAVLTVRLDEALKKEGSDAMKRCGTTPSDAVRRLFEYAAQNDALPFNDKKKPAPAEVRRRVEAFNRLKLSRPLNITDDEIRDARIRERYGLDG